MDIPSTILPIHWFTLHGDVIKWKLFRYTDPLWGESTSNDGFPSQRPVTQIFDIFFDLRLNKRCGKRRWFGTPPRWLWHHANDIGSLQYRFTQIMRHLTPFPYSMPEGLEDVSTYPALLTEMSNRGWTREELEKITGRNLIRAMKQAEQVRCQWYSMLKPFLVDSYFLT